mmetsp:Transcript_94292/g.224542  ORF Transcript_94292/g.224542 Transcript_94292/m.224542 type:complete len:201 (+) Transcript_94292:280-882(+)
MPASASAIRFPLLTSLQVPRESPLVALQRISQTPPPIPARRPWDWSLRRTKVCLATWSADACPSHPDCRRCRPPSCPRPQGACLPPTSRSQCRHHPQYQPRALSVLTKASAPANEVLMASAMRQMVIWQRRVAVPSVPSGAGLVHLRCCPLAHSPQLAPLGPVVDHVHSARLGSSEALRAPTHQASRILLCTHRGCTTGA